MSVKAERNKSIACYKKRNLIPLRQENVGYVSHGLFVYRVNRQNGDMEIHDGRLAEKFRRSVFVVASGFDRQNVRQLQALLIVVNQLRTVRDVAIKFGNLS